MKVWILGVKGMLGSSIARYLRQKKIDCVGTSKAQVNITSLDQLFSFASSQPFTHIVNCAAYTDVDRAETNI